MFSNRYFNGCNGAGADCKWILTLCTIEINVTKISSTGTNANCPTAFHNSNDNSVQVACQANNVSPPIRLLNYAWSERFWIQVNLAITFCD